MFLVSGSWEPAVLGCECHPTEFSSWELWVFQLEGGLSSCNRLFFQKRCRVLLNFRRQRPREFVGEILLRMPCEESAFVGRFCNCLDERTILDSVFRCKDLEFCEIEYAGIEKSFYQHCEKKLNWNEVYFMNRKLYRAFKNLRVQFSVFSITANFYKKI